MRGTAELFGSELGLDKVLTFAHRKFAIFSWHGCELEIDGTPSVAYLSEETPMVTYMGVHAALETARTTAASASAVLLLAADASSTDHYGPRVLVVGAPDAGKSTLAQLLVNYAVRAQRAPILVDLDCGQNSLAPPGCVAACALQHVAEPEGGFLATRLAHSPLVYFYGHTSPSKNEDVRRAFSFFFFLRVFLFFSFLPYLFGRRRRLI